MDDGDTVHLEHGSGLGTGILGVVAVILLAMLTIGYDAGECEANVVPEDFVVVERTVFPLPVKDVGQLVTALDRAWGSRVSDDVVPNVAPLVMPEGMDTLATSEKKRVFFRSLVPHVLAVNARIRAKRELLVELDARIARGNCMTEDELSFLAALGVRYKIDDERMDLIETDPGAVIEELMNRVDEIPPSMVLAQAAIESAWGTSRFAQEGNNLFGQWVFSRRGMRPEGADDDARYSVAMYDSIRESVESYERNINSLWAYEGLRKLRASLRAEGRNVDGAKLAEGLLKYSTRREAYVKEVRAVIRHNRLRRFDTMRLLNFNRAELNDLLEAHGDGVAIKIADKDA